MQLPRIPYYFRTDRLGTLATAISITGFLFIYFLEPFQVNKLEHRIPYGLMSVLKSALVTAVFLGYFWLRNQRWSAPEHWNVLQHIGHTTLAAVAVGVVNFFIRDLIYDNPHNWSGGYLVEEIRNAVLVNGFFNTLFLPLYYFGGRAPDSVGSPKEEPLADKRVLKVAIETEVLADAFELDLSAFLFAEANGNYTAFYLIEAGATKKELKRISLKALQAQVADYPQVVQTHRSFLVNTMHVLAGEGSAQRFGLRLRHHEKLIPVSRAQVQKVRALLQDGANKSLSGNARGLGR